MSVEVLLREFGLPLAALIILVTTGVRGDWIFGREFRDMVAERDEWRRIALQSLDVAERVTKR